MDYSIVVPVYNSSQTLPELAKELYDVMQQTSAEWEVIFVDDCSPDDSWLTLQELKAQYPQFKMLRLANNVGQWMSTLAGISKTKGKHIVTIDDDMEYVTADILQLIKAYHAEDVYLVYGIPRAKKNKSLSYKLFFKTRDQLLRMFFNKIQTESFKIFKREIYFDDSDRMRSQLHFEAYSKFVVSPNYVRHVDVGYRERYFGHSNHTILMKVAILFRYGIEYYKSPFRFPLYSLLFLSLVIAVAYLASSPMWIIRFCISLIIFNLLLIIGITGKYLSSIYFVAKGIPEYIIIEEL